MKIISIKFLRLLLLLTICFTLFVSCNDKSISNLDNNGSNLDNSNVICDSINTNNITTVSTNDSHNHNTEINNDINDGVLLVKTSSFSEELLGNLEYDSVSPLYNGSLWHEIKLSSNEDTKESYQYLCSLDTFDKVDYDYIMEGDGEIQSVDISGNIECNTTTTESLTTMGIRDAWDFFVNNEKHPGGSSDVIVAVIDTGVDYNHLDLRKNIWTNSGEIPNNGIDDDGNGYIDDYYGWDFVWNDKDPMDDNGHGTHVAGIIAADNNAFGVVGVAYNCRVMCLKAGNASGSFNNSDIAEAIQYAYMNGASVINMSFGGYSISMAVEEALEAAYNQCILVAAAGNDGYCNQPGCMSHIPYDEPSYPASLPFVIGVMSCNSTGTSMSYFSNYDHYYFNNYEYEVFACGEQISSTWPNNKYASLSGTSMAAPNVAGIAAILRSNYPDRDQYSTKFIQSQIVNTGTLSPDGLHKVANASNAMNDKPTPDVYLYDYVIYDDVSFSSKNNGNGVADAGETIHIGVKLLNIGGVASNVKITASLPEMETAATMQKNVVKFSNIGTYSIQNGDYVYNDELIIDEQNCFVIVINENSPNDYLVNITFDISYKNGLDNSDKNNYTRTKNTYFTIQNGESLPVEITSDLTLYNNKIYFLDHNVTIYSGASLTIEAGAKVELYSSNYKYENAPIIFNYGSIIINGLESNEVNIYSSDRYYNHVVYLENYGNLDFEYASIDNIVIRNRNVNSSMIFNYVKYTIENSDDYYHRISSKASTNEPSVLHSGEKISVKNSYITKHNFSLTTGLNGIEFENCTIIDCKFVLSCNQSNTTLFSNIFLGVEFELNSVTYADEINITNNVFSRSEKRIGNLHFTINKGREPKMNVKIESNILLGELVDYKISGLITGYLSSNDGTKVFDIESNIDNYNANLVWPYVTEIVLKSNNKVVHTIGKEKVSYEVYFSRPMDTSKEFYLYFGTRTPYSDYKISGTWVTPQKWVGTYSLSANIENGAQKFKFGEACAADDSYKELIEYSFDYGFIIDTSSAMAMNLQASACNDEISLTWVQDDYDTLMGYNVYRSESKDGNYVKLNTSVIPCDENTFVDTNAEPGKTYWYTFTVVLSDMSESKPAGKVSCTARDTISPNAYHTPVNQGYLNNNLVISCTASDNIGIQNVTLYYRTKGLESWKSLSMSNQNNKYSATIFGSELDLAGLEYYIVASDGINSISKGDSNNPYNVIIKDASFISRIGDVDGDGIVTTKDALMLMQCLNGDLLLSDDEFKRADLNGDKQLSSVEALRILQYINGKVANLDM